MTKINYKKLYEKQLLNEHTKKYIHIPFSWKRIGLFLLGSVLLVLSWFSIKIIYFKWSKLGLDKLFSCTENCNDLVNFMQLDICFSLIFTTILILLGTMAFFNLFEKIIYFGMNGILIIGLITGLIVVLIIGGLITGQIVGLIMALIIGLIIALIWQ